MRAISYFDKFWLLTSQSKWWECQSRQVVRTVSKYFIGTKATHGKRVNPIIIFLSRAQVNLSMTIMTMRTHIIIQIYWKVYIITIIWRLGVRTTVISHVFSWKYSFFLFVPLHPAVQVTWCINLNVFFFLFFASFSWRKVSASCSFTFSKNSSHPGCTASWFQR